MSDNIPQEEDVVPPSQQLDISSMTVDDDYQGARLEGGFRRSVDHLSILHGALCRHKQRIAVFQSKAGHPLGPAACTTAPPRTCLVCCRLADRGLQDNAAVCGQHAGGLQGPEEDQRALCVRDCHGGAGSSQIRGHACGRGSANRYSLRMYCWQFCL